MTDVGISVVVPTYNRSDLLARVVEALAAQESADAFEVVVVDNGSTDSTPAVIQRLSALPRPHVRSLRLDPNRGPGPARNAGWRAARGGLVLFTDDDCVPQPGWVAAMVARLAEADLVQGRTLTPPDQMHLRGTFSHFVEVTEERGFYETCNIGYRRSVLEALDGFDESYQRRGGRLSVFGDDVDLGWRAREAGYRSAFEHDALVFHDVRPGGLRDRLRLVMRSEGMVLAVKVHPALRERLEHRWFYGKTHPQALLVAAGGTLVATRPTSPGRWLAAGLLAIPWVSHYHGRVSRREWVTLVPRLLVSDLVETAVLTRGSIRHRTLLL